MRRQPTAEEYRAADAVLAHIRHELYSALASAPPMASPHEGYAVILEELDELWDEVKANRGTSGAAYDEAKQVAAMGARYMLDVAMGVKRTG